MQAEGYWIKRKKITEIEYGSSHIKYVIDNPEYYGTTAVYIKSCYQKYNEKIPLEGKGREEIIRTVISNGFIRVRHYVKPTDYWAVQCCDFENSKKYIINFINEKNLNMNSTMVITDIKDDKVYHFSYKNGEVYMI